MDNNNNINPAAQFEKLYQMYVNTEDLSDLELTLKTMRVFAENLCEEIQDPKAIDQLFSKIDTLELRRVILLSRNTDTPLFPIVGFEREGCNCWINALLSMIFACSTFQEMYEKISDHYREQYPALGEALEKFHHGIIEKKSVPAYVTQNVRKVFHALFGRKDPITNREVFSPNAYSQEDAREGFESLVGRSEEIGFQPKFLKMMAKTQYFHPIGTAREATLEELNRYPELEQNNMTTQLHNEYQINLNVPQKEIISFEQLLKSFFVNEGLEGDDPASYILPDGKIQSFKRILTATKFLQIPEELLVNINRFGENGSKIKTSLDIPQILTLPAFATTSNLSNIYELDFFVVHLGELGGGHYFVYRKMDKDWIEINDEKTRYVTNDEINDILQGKKGHTLTSYMHHYVLKKQGLFKVDYQNQGEGTIALHGSFNGWNEPIRLEQGTFFLDPSILKEGDYEFKFVLDQYKWLKGWNLHLTVGSEKEIILNTPGLEYNNGTIVLRRDNFDY